jgi:hypothetical protein
MAGGGSTEGNKQICRAMTSCIEVLEPSDWIETPEICVKYLYFSKSNTSQMIGSAIT